jgi:transcriptional regulator with XRE-family HTH domain
MVGSEFKKLRLSASYSQSQLADVLNVTIRTLTRWETDEVPIPKVAELALKYVVNEKLRKRKK